MSAHRLARMMSLLDVMSGEAVTPPSWERISTSEYKISPDGRSIISTGWRGVLESSTIVQKRSAAPGTMTPCQPPPWLNPVSTLPNGPLNAIVAPIAVEFIGFLAPALEMYCPH